MTMLLEWWEYGPLALVILAGVFVLAAMVIPPPQKFTTEDYEKIGRGLLLTCDCCCNKAEVLYGQDGMELCGECYTSSSNELQIHEDTTLAANAEYWSEHCPDCGGRLHTYGAENADFTVCEDCGWSI